MQHAERELVSRGLGGTLLRQHANRELVSKVFSRHKKTARRRLGYVTYALLYCESRSSSSYISCVLLYVATLLVRTE